MKRRYDREKECVVVDLEDARLEIKAGPHGAANHYYSVDLMGGVWPSDNDLITICDGDDPQCPRHFGGSVKKTPNCESASVVVYVD